MGVRWLIRAREPTDEVRQTLLLDLRDRRMRLCRAEEGPSMMSS
jgi:hypothetical protein